MAQSPIDVNIGKQLNILLGNMDVKPGDIVMDPMTGAMGYGLEYTYSVMERIRMTGLGGDKMLAGPMIVSPGQECAKVKEAKAAEAAFPQWGGLVKRAALWETATAMPPSCTPARTSSSCTIPRRRWRRSARLPSL